jgi:hypothetical protein
MSKRKTPEQIADEQRRYALAGGAHTAEEFEILLADPNQAIRAVAAANPDADDDVLARFARDRFWGVRIEVAAHPRASRSTLLSMLEADPRKRGVVHHAVRQRLESEGVVFDDAGLPLPQSAQ